jgi:hypothetical protein
MLWGFDPIGGNRFPEKDYVATDNQTRDPIQLDRMMVLTCHPIFAL